MGGKSAEAGNMALGKLALTLGPAALGEPGVSEREGQVLALLGDHLSQAEIAASDPGWRGRARHGPGGTRHPQRGPMATAGRALVRQGAGGSAADAWFPARR